MNKLKVTCDTPGCGHQWDYEGKNKYYATCPDCRSMVKVPGDYCRKCYTQHTTALCPEDLK